MTIRRRPKREDYQEGKSGEKSYQRDMAKWEQKFNKRYGS